MKVFDENGNPVENIFSQEELDAKIAEAVEAAKPKVEEKKTEEKKEEVKPADDVMAAITALTATVNNLVKGTEATGSSKYSAGLDDEKKAVFNTQFEALQKTGLYENTPEGIEKRAAAAYTLTTGETPDAGNFNMGNLSAIGGHKAPAKPATEMTEVDKGLSELLGNTEEDFKKHAGNTTT